MDDARRWEIARWVFISLKHKSADSMSALLCSNHVELHTSRDALVDDQIR